MKINFTHVPEETMREIRMLAVQQGVFLVRPKDYEQYVLDDEEALELVLPYIPDSPL